MPDITIPDATVEAAARAIAYADQSPYLNADQAGERMMRAMNGYRMLARKALEATAPHIAAQERQRVADEIDLPAVMAHLLRGSRDDLILADRINVAIGASRVRRIEADHG